MENKLLRLYLREEIKKTLNYPTKGKVTVYKPSIKKDKEGGMTLTYNPKGGKKVKYSDLNKKK